MLGMPCKTPLVQLNDDYKEWTIHQLDVSIFFLILKTANLIVIVVISTLIIGKYTMDDAVTDKHFVPLFMSTHRDIPWMKWFKGYSGRSSWYLIYQFTTRLITKYKPWKTFPTTWQICCLNIKISQSQTKTKSNYTLRHSDKAIFGFKSEIPTIGPSIAWLQAFILFVFKILVCFHNFTLNHPPLVKYL